MPLNLVSAGFSLGSLTHANDDRGALLEAIEFGAVSVTAPTLSAAGVTDIGMTSVRPQVTLTFTGSPAGTLYYAIYPAAMGSPSVTQIKAGQDPTGGVALAYASEPSNTTTGVQTWGTLASGLTSATSYKIAFVWSNGTVDATPVVGTFDTNAAASVFPVVESTATGRTTGNATSHPITMPSGIQIGDLVLCVFGVDGNPTVSIDGTSSVGWNISTTFEAGNSCAASVVWMIAESASPTLTLTTSASEESSHVVHRISGGSGVEFTALEGTTTGVNPPSHVSTYGNADTLWIATQVRNGAFSKPTNPSSYANGGHIAANTSGGASTTTVYRESRATSEDPGFFGTQTSSAMVSFTIAVRPAAFPFERAVATSGSASATSLAVTLPRHIAGDSLLVFVSSSAATSINAGSSSIGWQSLGSASNSVNTAIYFLPTAAKASETLTLSLSTGRIAVVAYSIGNAGIAAATSATGSGTAPDAPAITQPDPPEAMYFSSAGALRTGGSIVVSAGPSGYSAVDAASYGTSQYVVVGVSFLASSAAQDPGAMTLSSSQSWVAWGVSVKNAYTVMKRGLVLLPSGVIGETPYGSEGLYKPLTLEAGTLKQSTTGKRLVIENGTIREVATNEFAVV